MQILSLIRQRFCNALEGWVAEPDAISRLVTAARDAQHGDYQANIAMSLKAELGRSPRDIASELAERVNLMDLCEAPEIAGPGFINLRLRNDFLSQQLAVVAADPRLGVSVSATPRTVVVDYSAPNVAKPMHVGHIRSTVIGDSLARILRFLGHKVIADNHLGDWGTQFGMIIYGYKNFLAPRAFEQEPVRELSRLYRVIQQVIGYQQSLEKIAPWQAKLDAALSRLSAIQTDDTLEPKQKSKEVTAAEKAVRAARESLDELRSKVDPVQSNPELMDIAQKHDQMAKRCQNETVQLHEGDSTNLALWNEFMPLALREIEAVYRRLGIQFDTTYGESFYHPMLSGLVEQLLQQGVAVSSDGADCIFLEGFDAPMIVRKSDGAFLYATTDLATIQYRMQHYCPDSILYVVDFRQSDHFGKLFAAARAIGYDRVELNHVSFGTVLGSDGKPFKTRSGSVVGLESLLDEAVDRAYQAVCDPERLKKAGLEMSEQEKREIAQVVGLGAIKYADLSHNRTSDYEFNTEKMVALEGNTSTYIQYMYARTQSIVRRSGLALTMENLSDYPIQVHQAAERALALQILQFEDALVASLAEYFPNLLANYLYNLARQFATFFEQCSVLNADSDATLRSRLAICFVTGRVLKQGLELLGINVVPRM
jgi:arginyl-tRNA synthetase